MAAATSQIDLSVKSGKVDVSQVRDLRGVIEREKAQIGVLISLHEPTRPMRVEAAAAGFYTTGWNESYPHLQLLTIADLLKDKGVAYPAWSANRGARPGRDRSEAMPLLVHLTPEKYVARIVRNGIRTGRGVYCLPVLPSYYVSHQWLRELKRRGQRTILAETKAAAPRT
jgi:hypothetical protein